MMNTISSLKIRLLRLISSKKYDKDLTDFLGLLIDGIEENDKNLKRATIW